MPKVPSDSPNMKKRAPTALSWRFPVGDVANMASCSGCSFDKNSFWQDHLAVAFLGFEEATELERLDLWLGPARSWFRLGRELAKD